MYPRPGYHSRTRKSLALIEYLWRYSSLFRPSALTETVRSSGSSAKARAGAELLGTSATNNTDIQFRNELICTILPHPFSLSARLLNSLIYTHQESDFGGLFKCLLDCSRNIW